MRFLAGIILTFFCLASSAQTWFHVDRVQTSVSRPADSPYFYSPIHFHVDTSTDLLMRYVMVEQTIPRNWEANVATYDSLFPEALDSAEFMLYADSLQPNMLEVVFKPNNSQGHCTIRVKVFPVLDPSQWVELTFEGFATAPFNTAVGGPAGQQWKLYAQGPTIYVDAPETWFPLQISQYNLLGQLLGSDTVYGATALNNLSSNQPVIISLTTAQGKLLKRMLVFE
ncbi:MAG: hypothetical protein SFW35_02135 [Chitinophagales bacterium]|nr:hypothetical protein [Chitinophagales bacterium]